MQPLALESKWEGPYAVVRFRNNNYLVKHMTEPHAKKIKRHISHFWQPKRKVNLPKMDEDNIQKE